MVDKDRGKVRSDMVRNRNGLGEVKRRKRQRRGK